MQTFEPPDFDHPRNVNQSDWTSRAITDLQNVTADVCTSAPPFGLRYLPLCCRRAAFCTKATNVQPDALPIASPLQAKLKVRSAQGDACGPPAGPIKHAFTQLQAPRAAPLHPRSLRHLTSSCTFVLLSTSSPSSHLRLSWPMRPSCASSVLLATMCRSVT